MSEAEAKCIKVVSCMEVISTIAREELDLDTLETRNNWSDFHEHAVWQIKHALSRAYLEGYKAATFKPELK
jgi:hypothetical protein